MTTPRFHPVPAPSTLTRLPVIAGRIVVFVGAGGAAGAAARRINRLTRGALDRFLDSAAFDKTETGRGERSRLARRSGGRGAAGREAGPDRPMSITARKAGAAIGKALGAVGARWCWPRRIPSAAEISFGLALRAYDFTAHKTGEKTSAGRGQLHGRQSRGGRRAGRAPMAAVAEGVFFTRDLMNEPANVLTTDDFAARLAAMQELGLDVEILDEPELKKLGMGALLGVGQGSDKPVEDRGACSGTAAAKDEAPFARDRQGRDLRHRRHLDQARRAGWRT